MGAQLYALYFWRLFKQNPGNKLVECGSMTLIVFFVGLAIIIARNRPDWLFFTWIVLTILLCFTTLVFLLERVIRALAQHSR